MIDAKKYITTIIILLGIIMVGVSIINVFLLNLTHLFEVSVNIIVVLIVTAIIFSTIITYKVIIGTDINSKIMNINFKIVNFIFPMMIKIASLVGISKDEIRKVYVKLNNKYIHSQKYNLKNEDILILIPHCVQKSSCKLKVTTDIKNCKQCGLCNIGDLVRLKENKNVNIFVATGGTLARKMILENKPKAVIAVACERDLTTGVQDVSKIPVLGVFNKRPNGPCVDTCIDVEEVENAISFFTV
ncbi:DUF116 domain-containing protein [Romboutsia ilealis]|uniref:DUF116 domain-containing protein n=1 Tax=Romboutsia faecis TaxID=2764597 RepID=A0ABR7JM67_9FIRM|nr:DUF116 domain-containing protein [Romboutsia faecis]MBC5996012.1 DUF116 domain-containing protein [Romboutsia faecis]MRN23212.1 DUF116 domain-containing protein [Romboutsia ilealis]